MTYDAENRLVEENLRLSQAEYRLQHVYLRSQPRYLSLVLGNACNIDCPHCYQAKNGDNLLKPPEIAHQLRREFIGIYPYLSTLRVQGGEALAYQGFRELVEDVAATVRRPLLSISTNGTLIDEAWAERIVRTPFKSVTISIDGGTPETYARMRRGADLNCVLANARRIQNWKRRLGTELPDLDSFFVILRSNFREIPRYLELISEYGFVDVAMQTPDITRENSRREPNLVHDEVFADPVEIAELHSILRGILVPARRRFRHVRICGLQSLFEAHGLDAAFLEEQENGLYPDSEDLAGTTTKQFESTTPSPSSSREAPRPEPTAQNEPNAVVPRSPPSGSFELCPNPWTTLFVSENGNVHLCFLAEPVGNLYEAALPNIWNSPQAVAKRADMIAGRYMASGCSRNVCSWREGKAASPPQPGEAWPLVVAEATHEAADPLRILQDEGPSKLDAVRRMLAERGRRISELELLQAHYDNLREQAQRHIDHLEAKTKKAVDDYYRLESEHRQLTEENGQLALLRKSRVVRAAIDVAVFSQKLKRFWKSSLNRAAQLSHERKT